IKTTLEAVQTSWPNRRLVVVFQPHRYSRTKALFDSFARSFYQSDVLVVMPVYAASEEEIQGADHHALCGAICAHGHKRAYAEQDVESALNRLEKILEKGDIVLTLGAGNVWQVGDALSARLDRAVKRK
ncbi:MAG: glutamate ligase domain-containing protein, partial [Desulfosalsimonas sp.]